DTSPSRRRYRRVTDCPTTTWWGSSGRSRAPGTQPPMPSSSSASATAEEVSGTTRSRSRSVGSTLGMVCVLKRVSATRPVSRSRGSVIVSSQTVTRVAVGSDGRRRASYASMSAAYRRVRSTSSAPSSRRCRWEGSTVNPKVWSPARTSCSRRSTVTSTPGSASISFQIWSISPCSSSTSSRPFLKELPVKMSPNRGARTTRKPYAWSAQTAHSREDPQPKFSPATRTVAAVKGRRLRTKSGLSRQSANSAASSPVLSTPEQNRTGMIWSVSTSAIFIGAATPVCSSNFSIVLVLQVARCDESARDRARCGDGGRDQMGLDAGALSPLEVAVVGRGGALAGRVLVLVQSHAQRAPRVPQTHAGGLPIGAIPMSEMYAQASGGSPGDYLSLLVSAVLIANVVCVVFAAVLNGVGKRSFRSSVWFCGNGQLLRVSATDAESLRIPEKPSGSSFIALGQGLLIAGSLYVVASIFNSLVPDIHTYAWLTFIAAAIKIAGFVPN